jgi:hypothetical protein
LLLRLQAFGREMVLANEAIQPSCQQRDSWLATMHNTEKRNGDPVMNNERLAQPSIGRWHVIGLKILAFLGRHLKLGA